ncbi:Fasciclin domain protein [Ceratobasidium sp. AG-Ba]|nr:Fasciclin domain protein [Ceratobasidium sp. AG-Ba]
MLFNLLHSVALASSTIVRLRPYYAAGLLQALSDTQGTTFILVLEGLLSEDQGRELALWTQLCLTKPDNIAAIISYHIINGSYSPSTFATPCTHTIAPTRLTDGDYADMGGLPQVLEQAPEGDGLLVRQETGNGTVTSSTTYRDLGVHVIAWSDMPKAVSCNLVDRFSVSVCWKIGIPSESITVFAPVDDVFEAIASDNTQLPGEELASVQRNHIISDNIIYSNGFNGSTANAASGAELDLSTEDDVLYATFNETRARVLGSDVTMKNGVGKRGAATILR